MSIKAELSGGESVLTLLQATQRSPHVNVLLQRHTYVSKVR